MDSAVLTTLEYHKIREMLAERTGSVMAGELAKALLPSSSTSEVEQRLAQTEEAVCVLAAVPSVPLGGVRDIRTIVKRAELGSLLEPHEMLLVASTLYAARRLKTFFAELEVEAPSLKTLADGITVLRNIETVIDNTISEQGKVRDEASSELMKLRREIRSAQGRVKEKLDNILRSGEYQKYFQDALVTMRGDRYVIPIKLEYRQHFPGIVHDQSASGATLFIEPLAVVNLNNDIKQLVTAEKNEVNRILQVVSSQIGALAAAILQNCQALAEIDFNFAKAKLALDMGAENPRINSEGEVRLLQARHPLIPREAVVATDIYLGGDFDTLLITGPNTGGKTVTLKTIGLFALMAQAGLFLPAESGSEMPVFKNIFADIGDEQSIEQSLSTFSAHMTHLVKILASFKAGDLILLDEIGAGTDPTEGAALAMAMLEHFYQQGAKTVATTHYSELKTFAFTRPGIENACVEFDVQTLRPTYRLLIGIPGSSNAFAISQRLGLPEAIIARANQLTVREHQEFETVLQTLEEQKRGYSERLNALQSQERDAETIKRRIQSQQEQLNARKNQILEKAREEAAQLVRHARREAEAVIEDLKAQFSIQNEQDRQQVMQNSRQRLNKAMTQFSGIKSYGEENMLPQATPESLQPGMEIWISSVNQKGTVLAVNGKDVSVQLGILKMNVDFSVCRLLNNNTGKKQQNKKFPQTSSGGRLSVVAAVQAATTEVDIRGMTVEEGELVLEKFIDDAVLAGLNEVLVIHGKGTGALRKGIKTYLENHSSIKSLRMGELNEGGSGVTVARLS